MIEHSVKVIATSNFNDETYPEREIARFVDERHAHLYCDWLNRQTDETDPNWYVVVDVNKRLWKGMEDLV